MTSLKAILAELDYSRACEHLGSRGESLMRLGGQYEIDLESQVSLGRSVLWLTIDEATVTLSPGEDGLQST